MYIIIIVVLVIPIVILVFIIVVVIVIIIIITSILLYTYIIRVSYTHAKQNMCAVDLHTYGHNNTTDSETALNALTVIQLLVYNQQRDSRILVQIRITYKTFLPFRNKQVLETPPFTHISLS